MRFCVFHTLSLFVIFSGIISSASADDPVAWWAFDETEGVVAADAVGDADGLLVNGPVWTEGRVAGGLSCDGVDDYVQIPGYQGVTGTSSRTCMAWIKTDTTGAILSWGSRTPADGDYWYLFVNYSSVGEPGALHVSVMGANAVGTTDLRDGRWHHVAVVLNSDGTPDTSELLLYVDGQPEELSYAVSHQINTAADSDVYIGSRLGETSHLFTGIIDDVRLYDTALSQNDLFDLLDGFIVNEVWVDDDYTAGGANDGHIWGYDAFNKIQDGIDFTACGGVVHVAAGNYFEDVRLRKGIRLIGEDAASTIIDAEHVGGCVTSYNYESSCEYESLLEGFTMANGLDYLNLNTERESQVIYGSGLSVYNSDIIVRNCIFNGNSSQLGGGIRLWDGSSSTIENCLFINNTASGELWSNGWGGSGGGINIEKGCSATIRNCLFINNVAMQYGGGILGDGYGTNIINCVFKGNSAFSGGGVACATFTEPYVTNPCVISHCIIRDNTGGEIMGYPYVSYSNIKGCIGNDGWSPDFGYDRGGNIDAIPLYVDEDGVDDILGTLDDDFRLQAISPCIDAGNNEEVTAAGDADGRLRILDGDCDGIPVVDMGAYEYKPIAGDVDGSCSVDIADVLDLAENWLQQDCSPCQGADLNLDGDVTFLDLSVLSNDWLEWKPGAPDAWWTFDETDGMIAADSMGDANGLLVNGPVWSEGRVDGGLLCDGVDDYVQIPDYQGVTGTSSRTCMAWIKTDTTGAILSWGSRTPTDGDYWYLLINHSSVGEPGALCVSVMGGSVAGTTDLRDGQWHHIAVVLFDDGTPDASELLLYVDGQPEALSYLVSHEIKTAADSDVYIGSRLGETSNLFTGVIDNVRIYNVALNQKELIDILESDIADQDAWWAFDETEGVIAADSVGEANGLLVTSPVWTQGIIDGALFLDSDDYVQIPDYQGVTGTSSRTCTAWIKTDTTGAILSWGSSRPVGGDYWYMLVNYSTYGNPGALHVSVAGGNVVGTTDLRDGQWHHVAVVMDDDGSPDTSELQLYVDGRLETISYVSSQEINTTADSDVYIGSRFGEVSHSFIGTVDDVGMYHAALGQEELIDVMAGDVGDPVARWRFDETDGMIVTDSVGNANGLIVRSPVWSEGIVDGGLFLDGDDYLQVPGYQGVTGPVSRTCMAWIKTDTTGAILSWGSRNPVGGDYWYMFVNYSTYGTPGALHVSVSGGNVVGTTDLRDGRWHHIAVVLDSVRGTNTSELKLYVDGHLEVFSYVSSQAINTLADSDVYVGSRFGETSNLFTGVIDNVRICNVALDQDALIDVIEDDLGDLVDPTHWWTFDETSGVIAADSIGDANGLIVDDPVWTEGRVDGGLFFAGEDDYGYVRVPDYQGVTGTSSRMCMAWVKTETTGAILSWGSSTPVGGDYWYMFVNYSSVGEPGALHVSVMGGNAVGTTDLRDGQWHHIAVILNDDGSPDASELLLYVDGQLEALSYVSSQAIHTAADLDVYIGSRFGETSHLFTGIIDDVRIYELDLAAMNILCLYHQAFLDDVLVNND